MLDNQSKTLSLLQLSVPQEPLLPQPFGMPESFVLVEQLVHAIYIEQLALLVLINKNLCKDTNFSGVSYALNVL
ncbi:hypothetical protein P3875_09925 [Myroides sp. JBRI-B21084]|uniref:hypothetical protein n=1 Tax=Myroides sp. JBRI-B21084 TaxID=3119977 RepID=UPI0026E12CEC|nr:hypothetical protein [Paenimyroides cloacae]WKW46094.1 hypothetical protein P3875_09925 [Paenimyroides cloacae]